MEDYIAEANSDESVITDALDGTEVENPFADDNSEYAQVGYEDVPEADVQSETSHVNWEDESKKWQSMYDKSQTSLNKLEDALSTAVEMQQSQQNSTVSQQTEAIPQVTEEEFNPWDAYYKPDSPSYKLRVNQQKEMVNGAIEGHLRQMNESIALNNTINELKNVHKMPDEEVKEFLEFVTQPKEQIGLDNLVKLYQDVNGRKGGQQGVYDSLEAVRASKKAPVTAGAIQGQDSRVKRNPDDQAWKGVLEANNTGRLP